MAPFASDRRMFNFLGHDADPAAGLLAGGARAAAGHQGRA